MLRPDVVCKDALGCGSLPLVEEKATSVHHHRQQHRPQHHVPPTPRVTPGLCGSLPKLTITEACKMCKSDVVLQQLCLAALLLVEGREHSVCHHTMTKV